MQKKLSRRRFVEAAGAASIFALAGCTDDDGEAGEEGEEAPSEEDNEADDEDGNETAGLEEDNETEGDNETNETNESDDNETNETADEESETIQLGGDTGGWQGEAPSDIEGETNPTLSLQAETTYELVWENLDGEEHELIIEDADGNELEVSDESEEEGETVTLMFDATEEMASYYCEYHPEMMRGEISVE